MHYWLLFFFVTVGAKLVLAALMIFLLLPTDRRCSRCDEETLLMKPGRMGRFGGGVTLGRLQWRWCPRCGWEGAARRRGPERPRPGGSPARPAAPTRP